MFPLSRYPPSLASLPLPTEPHHRTVFSLRGPFSSHSRFGRSSLYLLLWFVCGSLKLKVLKILVDCIFFARLAESFADPYCLNLSHIALIIARV
ncbi:hypothetical protein RIF29_14503 [Crotalaria pallida]|uniref:Uncharacterized protein n=1 Tax=Crotalaria pallida TaxID=3830 RepID=A0AAN9FK71_CROPI